MRKQVINLLELEADYLGLIILHPTGVLYTNQMGGTACGHPLAEGLYVPLSLQGTYPDALLDWREHLWTRYVQKKVQEHINELGLDNVLAPVHQEEQSSVVWLECVPEDSRCWGEAWLPVKVIRPKEEFSPNALLLKDFEHYYGILTYNNSD